MVLPSFLLPRVENIADEVGGKGEPRRVAISTSPTARATDRGIIFKCPDALETRCKPRARSQCLVSLHFARRSNDRLLSFAKKMKKHNRVHRDGRRSTRGSTREKFEIAGSRAAGNESPVGMARLLIPSELRNPFPSNSLNYSASSSSSSSFSTFSSPSRPPPAPRLFRLTFPGCIPHSARVGIQRPHNRLLTRSIFLLLSSLVHSPPLSSLFLFLLSTLGALLLLPPRLGRIFHRHRNAVLLFPRKRNETEEERRRREHERG